MAVLFKFRSSPTFDSIDIGNLSFISIRDLKSEIIKKKHLNICQDFDLVFSDSLSGQEYTDESIRIPSGSSVIIKRVPAASTAPLRSVDASAGCFGGREVCNANIVEPSAENVAVSSFDDFGADLCPLPDENLADVGKLQSVYTEDKNFMDPRCSEKLLVRCNELDATSPRQCAPKDSGANEDSTLVILSKPKTEEQAGLERNIPTNQLVMERSDMPSELKCILCKNFFEDAVMIPCCQRSFCEKCIRLALLKDGKCPMCSSTKCKADDLLPNVSLRQAIERFLQSQLLHNEPENDLTRDAPDGESGIRVGLSYAATKKKRDLQLNCPASGSRSSHVLLSNMHDHADRGYMNCVPVTREESTEFQGENDPQNVVRADAEEADSCMKKDRTSVVTQGGERNFAAPSRLQMGQRTCYGCGSPDHLIRDCPIAAGSQANHWNGDPSVAGPALGCPPLYWPGNAPNVRPFINMYGGPGMIYCANMPPMMPSPMKPCGFSSYAPSMYGTYPFPSGRLKMGMRTMAPAIGNHLQPSYREVLKCRDHEHRNYGISERERDGHQIHGSDPQHDYRGICHSNDNLATGPEGKHIHHNNCDDNSNSDSRRREKVSCQKGGRDHRISESDKSTSEKYMRDSRSHLAEDRHEKHYRSSRMDSEREMYANESKKESMKRMIMEHDERRYGKELHNHSRSSKEHSYSSDSARQRREESSYIDRHPKKSAKSNDKEHHRDRDRRSRYSDDDCGGYHHDHKRKRFH